MNNKREGAGNETRNVGAVAGESERHTSDDMDRAFGKVIAGLSILVRVEPGVSHCVGGSPE
jgi:hypothetical protein